MCSALLVSCVVYKQKRTTVLLFCHPLAQSVNISIINENKITVGLNSGIIRCMVSETRESAARFCHAFDELRHYFRFSSIRGKKISLAQQRQIFCERFAALQELMVAIP
jgi:hypothetical protein